MIKYSLICDDGHRFDSWFASADAFETLQRTGMVSCAVCGSVGVSKAMMAPNVAVRDRDASAPGKHPEKPLATPSSAVEQALSELRRQIEAESDYVGRDFAREARAIHLGEAPRRAIYGETNLRDAQGLIEDGVPVVPLPFNPRRKTN